MVVVVCRFVTKVKQIEKLFIGKVSCAKIVSGFNKESFIEKISRRFVSRDFVSNFASQLVRTFPKKNIFNDLSKAFNFSDDGKSGKFLNFLEKLFKKSSLNLT